MPIATSEQLEALQAEISRLEANKRAMFAPIGGYNLESWWNLMMSHGVVFEKDANGSRTYYQKIRKILTRIDGREHHLVIAQYATRSSRKVFENCLILSTDTWLNVIKEAGITPQKHPEFFSLFE